MDLKGYARLSEDELADRVRRLKREHDAVILGHNYQIEGVQLVSDYLGDSLRLAQLATETDASLIALCGVRFMAESAKILNPEKKVILPSESAGCPMADMIDGDDLRRFKAAYPGVPVVCYVNTSAEVKAESDVCCTSSNAVDIVRALEAERVLFVPDRNLASYVATKVKAEVIPWQGHCYVHDMFVVEDVELARAEHPGVPIVVHPESPPGVIELSDYVASTGGMMKLAAEHDELIVGTEIGMVERMNREYPERDYYPLSSFAVCRNMKMTDLPRLAWALEHEQHEIEIPAETLERARGALSRMLELS
ncbi:MAG: quinolinate synthase NadA [Candidatus Eisenbacteria bacterium]|nr:quinolinate synthase NadA [Candidatus Eisenbacteria bacterium]